MRKIWFGRSANINNVAKTPGNVIITEDTGEMYADNSKGTRQKIGCSKADIDDAISAAWTLCEASGGLRDFYYAANDADILANAARLSNGALIVTSVGTS